MEENLSQLDPGDQGQAAQGQAAQSHPEQPTSPVLPPITVYWRPGCPFCMTLERSMKKSGLHYDKRNIWEEPEAAAYVRSVADGNEVVPTVSIGSQALVNPNMGQIVQAIGEESGDNLTAEELEALTGSRVDAHAGPLGKLLGRILSK